jgi:hypothetical protein
LQKENIRLKTQKNSNKTNQTPVSVIRKPKVQLGYNSQQAVHPDRTVIASVIQEPKVMLPQDFRNAIMNKTMDEVTQVFGKPDLVSDLGVVVFWRYDGKIKDLNNSYITSASVRFENGIVGNVLFS